LTEASTELVLVASAGALEMSIGPNRWTKLRLTTEGHSRPLGAEMFDGLARRLLTFLRSPSPELRWVLSLAEPHCTFYGIASPGGAVLRFQSADAAFFADLLLTASESASWIQQLEIRLLSGGKAR
jgi:hypothetical protein